MHLLVLSLPDLAGLADAVNHLLYTQPVSAFRSDRPAVLMR